MSHSESLTYQWTLFCFLSLFNNQMLAWSRESSPPDHQFLRHKYVTRSWSEWSQWSSCSRTCGGGVRQRTRVCVARMLGYRASSGGCSGETTEHELCSRHVCSDSEGFLDFQCSQKNGQTILGKRIDDWIPYRYRTNPCELQCWPKDRSLVYSFGKVVDGTQCPASDPKDPAVCVNGRCTLVDCAGHVGLQSRRDKCGVCQGDNSTCVRYHNTFFGRPRYKLRAGARKDHEYDYISIFSIPAGAMHITVSENSATNFLVLVDHMGNYLINGNRRVQPPGRLVVHGSEFIYNRTEDGHEIISSVGPSRFILKVMVMGSGDIPTVHYEYWISTVRVVVQTRPQHLLQTTKTPSKQPFHNSVETSSAETKTSPLTKLHSYKSFYHRNEILKSVPSWSIKRHKSLKQSSNKPFANADSRSGKWRNGTNDRLRHLETFNRNGHRTTIPPPTKAVNYVIQRYDAFGRPNGTSAFTRYSRVVTNYEDRNRTFKEVETTPGIKQEEDNERKIVPRKIKSKPEKVDKGLVKRKRKSDQGQCFPCLRNKQQTKNFCKSDFVIRAIVLAFESHHRSVRFEFEVIRSYKNKVPMLSREYVWTPDSCQCPKLRVGKEYILMGHSGTLGGRRESQLIVDRDSFVRQYSQKRARTMLRLVRDQHTVCKKY